MSRYRFRLEAVLRLRRAQEESAKSALLVANTKLRAALEGRDRADERYRAFAAGDHEVHRAGELSEERLAAGLLAESASNAHRAAIAVASEAALARVQWSKAAKGVAILERLDERRRADHFAEEQRSEASFVDDIVAARYRAAEPSTGSFSMAETP